MSLLRDLQEAAAVAEQKRVPGKERVRWTDYEWKLLAKAILIEMFRDPASVGKPLHQYASIAQERQKILLHAENENSWIPRKFNGIMHLAKAQKFLYEQFKSLKEDAELMATASNEAKTAKDELSKLKTESSARIAALEAQVATLKTKKASWEDFTESEVIEQALLIQAERAERMERASTEIQSTFKKILEAVDASKTQTADHINEVKAELQTSLEAAILDLPEKLQALMPAPTPALALVSPPPTPKPVNRIMNGNGKHHHHKKRR